MRGESILLSLDFLPRPTTSAAPAAFEHGHDEPAFAHRE
jgi:hypothetical protein